MTLKFNRSGCEAITATKLQVNRKILPNLFNSLSY